MGLNIYPHYSNNASLGFPGLNPGPTGALDLNWGSSPIGLAPAASAAPTVPTAGVPIPTNVGMSPDVVTQNAMNTSIGTVDPAKSLSDGLGWGNMKFMDKANVVLGGIGTLGKIWSAFQANKIARDSLDFQKQAFDTNLSNQRASYNVALEDRADSRAAYAGTPEARAAADEYIAKHRI